MSSEALEAAALSDIYTSCSGAFLQASVLTTFVSQARGAGNAALGAIWFQVSLVCVLALTVPVMLLWMCTGPVLSALGTRKELADDAGYYALVLALCLPIRGIMQQYSKLFAGNGFVFPEVYTTAFGAFVNLFLGLLLVLGIPTHWKGFGFVACPWVTVSTEYMQFAVFYIVFCAVRKLHRKCGFTVWKLNEVTRQRVVEFMRLYLPVALSTASDFWRVAVLGVFAASLGELEVGVFNASFRILWMTLTVVGALGAATGIRLSSALGAADKEQALRVVKVGLGLTLLLLLGLSATAFLLIREIAQVFSNDPEVLNLFEEARLPLSTMLFLMNLGMFLEQIPAAMGKTKVIFYAGFAGSWLGQVPCAFLAITYWRKDVIGLYTGVSIGYGLLCALLLLVIACTGFDSAIEEARQRNRM